MLKIKKLKFHDEPMRGYKRTYEECKTCKRVYYHDFVPYSLSNPIITLPCGHGIGERSKTNRLEEQEGMRRMLEQEAERRFNLRKRKRYSS